MNTAHSHHGDGHAGGRNQGNRQVSQAAGDHILIELFADAGEEQDGHGVTQGRADGVGNRLQEVIVGFNVDEGDTQDGTVRGDQGQVDPHGLMKGGHRLFHEHFNELDQGRDGQDEDKGLQVGQIEGDQDEVVQGIGKHGSKKHNKGYGCPHAKGVIEVLGNAQEGAHAQEPG